MRASSRLDFRSGRTTSTTIALAALLTARHLTNAYDRKPQTHCHRRPSVARLASPAHYASGVDTQGFQSADEHDAERRVPPHP